MEPVKTFFEDGFEYRLKYSLHREDGPAFVSRYESHRHEYYLYGIYQPVKWVEITPVKYKTSLININYVRSKYGA